MATASMTDQGGALGRLVARPLFWIVLCGTIFGLSLYRGMSAPMPEFPPVLAQLPEFQMTNERGEPFGSAQLKGKPYIANFIFTSCTDACPKISKEMQKIQYRTRHLRGGFTLVSFSVDPRDTPEKLAAYARENQAIPSQWVFLTGTMEEVKRTVTDGFKLALEPDEALDILHSDRFVLVDGQGRIRGYYDQSPEGEEKLLTDVGLLANWPGK